MLTSEDHTEIKAAIDGLDQVATQAERKWGIGRLRLLVDDSLRARFDRQQVNVDKVLSQSDALLGDILTQIAAMRRAWAALEQAAFQSGHKPQLAAVVECPLPEGGLIAIVAAGDQIPPKDDRWVAVYTAVEVGRIVASFKEILFIKRVIPDSEVDQIRVKRPRLDRNVPFELP